MMADYSEDLYEAMEISPNASSDTVERVFRYLSQRYHPDHAGPEANDRFAMIIKAYKVLRDPEKRAHYDLHHKTSYESHWQLFEDSSSVAEFDNDLIIQNRLLSVLYMKRRRNMQDPGMGDLDIERVTGCPREHLAFHIWYLKEKGWIGRMENGLMTITSTGIDRTIELKAQFPERLLTDQSSITFED